LFETAPVLRKGDLLLEDRGFVDGKTGTLLKHQRHVDVIVPLKAKMLSYTEAAIVNLTCKGLPVAKRHRQG
jgi:hypothetical protein